MNTHIFLVAFCLLLSRHTIVFSLVYNKILSCLDHLSRVRYRCTHTQNIWALLKVHINKTKYLCYASLFIGPACNIHKKLDWTIEKKVACKIKAILEKNDMVLSLSSSTMQLTLHIHTAGSVVGTKTIGSMTNVTSWFIPLDSFHVKHLTEWYNCTWLCSGPSYIGRWVTSSIAVKCHIITLSNRRGTLLDCHHWCIWK